MFTCSVCRKTFSYKFNLTKHSKNTCSKSKRKSRFICPESGCTDVFQSHYYFTEHLRTKHCKDIKVQQLFFNSVEDFTQWRYEMERKTISRYIKETSTCTLKDGVKKTYLVCHRSNIFRSEVDHNRRRALKSQGSCKIGSTCPARIDMSQYRDLTVLVKFWSLHCGHSNDPRHLTLDKPAREEIAKKLQAGLTFGDILNEVRNSKEQIERLKLLERKDLHNILASHKIPYDTKHHDVELSFPNDISSDCSYSINISNDEIDSLISLQEPLITLQEVTVDTRVSVKETLECRVAALLDMIRNESTKIDEGTALEIRKKVDSAIALLGGASQTESDCLGKKTQEIKARKKIKSQSKSSLTKQKSILKNYLKKTALKERLRTDHCFKSVDQNILNDHSYCSGTRINLP